MSLLLRGNRGKDGGGRQNTRPVTAAPSGLNRRALGGVQRTATVPATSVRRASVGTYAGGGQAQEMLQRKVVTPISGQRQVINQQQQATHRAQQQPGDQQGVISMEEVMNDLRLLEEHQREAQRKVATAKMSKQHKTEQQEKAEQKIASIRYSNAQQREQLDRCRQILSLQTREFGCIKLRSTKAADDLKRFDDKLRGGLQVLEALMRYHRIVETRMVQQENSSAILVRLRVDAEKKLQAAKTNLENCEHQENLLTKALQTDKNETRALSEKVLHIRSVSNELEQDLTIATQIETRTKISLETKRIDIESDNKRHRLVMDKNHSIVSERQVRRTDIRDEIHRRKALLDEKRQVLLLVKEECENIQKEEGRTNPDGGSALDITLTQLRLEEQERFLVEEIYRRDSLKQRIEALENQVTSSEDKATGNTRTAETRQRDISSKTTAEREQSERYQSLCMEVEQENADLVKLRATVTELIEGLQKRKEDVTEELEQLQTQEEDLRGQLVLASRYLQSETGLLEEVKQNYEEALDSVATQILVMKGKTQDAQIGFQTAQDGTKAFMETFDNSQLEFLHMAEAHQILLQETLDEVSTILGKYPSLAKLDVSFNALKCQNEQSESALANLRAGCQGRLDRAHEDWKKRYEMAQRQYLESKRKEEEEKRQRIEEEERLREVEEERALKEAERLRLEDERLREIERQQREEERARQETEERIAAEAEARRVERIIAKRKRVEEEERHRKVKAEQERVHKLETERLRQEEERLRKIEQCQRDEARARQNAEERILADAEARRVERIIAKANENVPLGAKKRSQSRMKNSDARLERKEKKVKTDARRLDLVETNLSANLEARAAVDRVCREGTPATYEGCTMSDVERATPVKAMYDVSPSQNKKRRGVFGYGRGKAVENPKKHSNDGNHGDDVSKHKRKHASSISVGQQNDEKSKDCSGSHIELREVESDLKARKKSLLVSWTDPTSGNHNASAEALREEGRAERSANKRKKPTFGSPKELDHGAVSVRDMDKSRTKHLAPKHKTGRTSHSKAVTHMDRCNDLDGRASIWDTDTHQTKQLPPKDRTGRTVHGKALSHIEHGKTMDVRSAFREVENPLKCATSTAVCGKAGAYTANVAPLIQAALTAASQETERASQASTKMRSRHKQAKSTKKLDIFASNDVGFLSGKALCGSNEKNCKSSKTKEDIAKSSRSTKVPPFSTNERRRQFKSNTDAIQKRRVIDKASTGPASQASGFTSNEKLGCAESKSNSNVRIRRKKSASKAATQQSFEADFSFM